MNRQEHTFLLAERTTLQRLLEDTTPDDVLERSGLEARMEEVQEQLAAAGPLGREPARARLTFRGRPVIGSYGIFAEFGANATNAFTDAVAKVAAALSGPLAAKGPVPNRQASQMLITSTAVGSFGFELVEHAPEELGSADESAVAQALDLTRKLLESTLGNDDELAELAQAMKDMLCRVKGVLRNPPYNFILHTAPPRQPRLGKPDYWESVEYDYHWHIELVPRLTQIAGFEWGTGFYINPTSPEDAATFLREMEIG